MHKYLELREIGFHRASVLREAERARRTFSLKLSQGKEIFTSHTGAVNSLDVDLAEGRYLLSGAADATIAVFDLQPPVNEPGAKIKPLLRISRHEGGHTFGVSCVQWYPFDSGLFFTGSFDETVRIWDPNTLQTVKSFVMDGKVYALSLSPVATMHSLIAVGSEEQRVRLCDPRAGTSTHRLMGHTEAIMAVKWSPANEFVLITGSQDRTVRMWDIRKAGALKIFDQHYSDGSRIAQQPFTVRGARSSTALSHNGAVTAVCFTPDGRFLLSSGTDHRMRCWDLETGADTLANYPGTRNSFKQGSQLAVSANGAVVYHPCGSDTLAFLLHSGQLVDKYQGHYDRVNACCFHPFHEELYTGGSDFKILVYAPAHDSDQPAEPLIDDQDYWSDGY